MGGLASPVYKRKEIKICVYYKLAIRIFVQLKLLDHSDKIQEIAYMTRILASIPLQQVHRIPAIAVAADKNLLAENYGAAHKYLSVCFPFPSPFLSLSLSLLTFPLPSTSIVFGFINFIVCLQVLKAKGVFDQDNIQQQLEECNNKRLSNKFIIKPRGKCCYSVRPFPFPFPYFPL